MWGGTECTVNRVGDAVFDQLARNGHTRRLDDLDRFAELGIRTVRFPLPWERTAPDGLDRADWDWADRALDRAGRLGMRPILGLVHHGSGPRSTCLDRPDFASGLAAFAEAVARRYPRVDGYTPVNEPLTTARFSGLYGVWYPHGRDDRTFARALLTQCRGVVLAMQAIRAVNPTAELVQTDDLGHTWSTPALGYQADFENARRWLTWDLLCGWVDERHPLWWYLLGNAGEAEVRWFQEHACPPDVIGVNHYLSSERFLDERLERYPGIAPGGNGRHAYVDVMAVRACLDAPAGPRALLREAWERYRRPIAVTEVHNGCTREEQMRWLLEVWRAAVRVRGEGGDVRAVTAWSLLGAYDWDSLVTRETDRYEPGAFDIRAPEPRPTALAAMLPALAAGREPEHPVLASPGWWRRPERLHYPSARTRAAARPLVTGAERVARLQAGERRWGWRDVRPILITGARGTFGHAFARLCEVRGLAHVALARDRLDVAEPASVQGALDLVRPWAVINAAGFVRVDDAEREPDACSRENVDGPAVLAAACARLSLPLVTFSSDLVFDGTAGRPYVETDPPAPLSVYGRSKAEAERRVLAVHPSALVVRSAAFFGPFDRSNAVQAVLGALERGEPATLASDAVVSPTYVPDLVNAVLDLLLDGEHGLWHLANAGAVTWERLGQVAAALAGLDGGLVRGVPTADLALLAPRPLSTPLASARGWIMPRWEDALERYLVDRVTAGPVEEGERHVRRRLNGLAALMDSGRAWSRRVA